MTSPLLRALAFAAVVLLASGAALAQASTERVDVAPQRLLHVLSIGVNAGTQGLPPLRYADDDAVRIVELVSSENASAEVALHGLLDDDTTRQHPQWAERVQAPSLDALQRSAHRIAAAIDRAQQQGRSSEVLVWLSGHGTYDDDGVAYVPLDGERLTAAKLKALIEPLTHAHRVHVVVDTCFAAAMVQTRASVASASTSQVNEAFDLASLRQFANVGLLLGASSTTESLEWERVQGGVFSALVRSAVRGVADADADGTVTYNELGGFFAAARVGLQREGADQAFVVLPPRTAPSASFAQRAWLADDDDKLMSLPLRFASAEPFLLFDARGEFVAGGHPEPDAKHAVWLAKGRYFALTPQGEQTVVVDDDITWQPTPSSGVAERGRLDEALSRGLFQQPFGARFLAGFSAQPVPRPSAPTVARPSSSSSTAWFAWGAGLAGASVVSGTVAVAGATLFFATDRQVPAFAGLGVGAAAGVVAVAAAAGAVGALAVGWTAE